MTAPSATGLAPDGRGHQLFEKANPIPVSPHRIVFANEKGGTGKSTTAVHVAIALAYQGARVAAIDLDPRQRTLHRYLENRAETPPGLEAHLTEQLGVADVPREVAEACAALRDTDLRAKLRAVNEELSPISTHRGMGYSLGLY